MAQRRSSRIQNPLYNDLRGALGVPHHQHGFVSFVLACADRSGCSLHEVMMMISPPAPERESLPLPLNPTPTVGATVRSLYLFCGFRGGMGREVHSSRLGSCW